MKMDWSTKKEMERISKAIEGLASVVAVIQREQKNGVNFTGTTRLESTIDYTIASFNNLHKAHSRFHDSIVSTGVTGFTVAKIRHSQIFSFIIY